MKLSYFASAAVAAAILASVPASAAVQVTNNVNNGNTITVVAGSPQSYGLTGSYTPDATATGLFTFILGATATVSASVFSTDSINASMYTFTRLAVGAGNAAAYSDAGPFIASTTTVTGDAAGYNIRLTTAPLAAGTYTLSLKGNDTSPTTVNGTISFAAAAVPEAATWAMMVMGFGVVGGALRTSRRKVVFA